MHYCSIILSRVMNNIYRSDKYIGKRISNDPIIGLKLENYIYFHKVIELLNFLGNFR